MGKMRRSSSIFNPEPKPTPKEELADGSVDFKNIDLIRQVSKEMFFWRRSRLLRVFPERCDRGCFEASHRRDLHLILGKNVKWDGMLIQAMADGIPVLEGRRIEVHSL